MRTLLLMWLVSVSFSVQSQAVGLIEKTAEMKAQSDISSQDVCLDDLVNESWIKSRCQIDRKNCCRWNLNGQLSKTFKRTELQGTVDHIDFGGISVKLVSSNENRSDEITVKQTMKQITPEEIAQKIAIQIESRNIDSDEKISLSKVTTPTPVFISTSAKDWAVELPAENTALISARIYEMNESKQTLGWASASLNKVANVYIAKKTIRPTEKISIDDFQMKTINSALSQEQIAYYTKANFPAGVRARITIRAGQPLTTASVERMPLVQLGEYVTLILRSDSLRISTKGVVQATAAEGEMVSVQLPRYNRMFRGKLQASKTVEVWF